VIGRLIGLVQLYPVRPVKDRISRISLRGIPHNFETMTTKIGNTVQSFYNQSPFPDFELERFDTRESLMQGARSLPKALDKQIPFTASVIDIGTGTGQLSAFLSLNRNMVYGIDFSDSSLAKAHALKEKLRLDTLHLKKVDILDADSLDSVGMKFDYVLCLGVLHHTGDTERAFQNITRLLKPGGLLAVGLYNTFGRIPLKMRILLAKTIFQNNQKMKDYFIRLQLEDITDKEKVRGWWNDQYLHPHETTHTIGEVLRWFKDNNIEYCQSLPPLYRGERLEITSFWSKTLTPSPFKRFFAQLRWIKETHREGGYWITFGRKK